MFNLRKRQMTCVEEEGNVCAGRKYTGKPGMWKQ